MQTGNTITCPTCGSTFDVNSAIYQQAKLKIEVELTEEYNVKKKQMADEFETKEIQLTAKEKAIKLQEESLETEITKRVSRLATTQENDLTFKIKMELEQENRNRTKLLNDELDQKTKQLTEFKDIEIEHAQMKRQLLDIENEKIIIIERAKYAASVEKEKEYQQKLNEERIRINEHQKKKEEEQQLKDRENEKIINDLKKKIDDTQRVAEQGSVQMQGEIQELALEEMLKKHYPSDVISPVKTGERGADIMQIVKNDTGDCCGKILYESKRTLNFQKDWIEKLKSDGRKENADILVIATQAMPANKTEFYLEDGVWICPYKDIRAFSLVLRHSLIRWQRISITQKGKDEKMVRLYDFMTGEEFERYVKAIINGFEKIKESYEREKKQMLVIWSLREKQLDLILANTAEFCGKILAIAGETIPVAEILLSELSEKNLLQDNT